MKMKSSDMKMKTSKINNNDEESGGTILGDLLKAADVPPVLLFENAANVTDFLQRYRVWITINKDREHAMTHLLSRELVLLYTGLGIFTTDQITAISKGEKTELVDYLTKSIPPTRVISGELVVPVLKVDQKRNVDPLQVVSSYLTILLSRLRAEGMNPSDGKAWFLVLKKVNESILPINFRNAVKADFEKFEASKKVTVLEWRAIVTENLTNFRKFDLAGNNANSQTSNSNSQNTEKKFEKKKNDYNSHNKKENNNGNNKKEKTVNTGEKKCWSCGGSHLNKYCPNKKDDNKDKEKNNNNNKQEKKLNVLTSSSSDPVDSIVVLCNDIPRIGYFDSGCTMSAAGKDQLMELIKLGAAGDYGPSKVEKYTLGNTSTVKVLGQLKLTLKFELAKNVSFNMVFQILDCDTGKLYFSKEFAKKIGVNVDSILLEKIKEIPEGEIVINELENEESPMVSKLDALEHNYAIQGKVRNSIFEDTETAQEEDLEMSNKSKVELGLENKVPSIEKLFPIMEQLNETEKARVQKLYNQIVQEKPITDPIKNKLFSVELINPETTPCSAYSRKFSLEENAFMNEMEKIWIEKGWVSRGTSEWTSRLFLVPKGDSYRCVVDYTGVNKKIKPDFAILPSPEDVLLNLNKCRFYMNLDLKHYFQQFQVDDKSSKIIAIRSVNSVLLPHRVREGLRNIPGFAQRAIVSIINEKTEGEPLYVPSEIEVNTEGKTITRNPKTAYIDDIIAGEKTFNKSMDLLENTLYRLRANNVNVNWSKSCLLSSSVNFLDKTFSINGMTISDKRVKTIKELPIPTTGTELMEMCAVMNYCRNFIPRYANIAEPLQNKLNTLLVNKTKRTKRSINVQINMTETEKNAFKKLKETLIERISISFPDVQKQQIIITDASASAISGAIFQIDRAIVNEKMEGVEIISKGQAEPLAFVSRMLRDSELKYDISDKEIRALSYTLKQVGYLINSRAIVLMDNTNAISTLTTENPNLLAYGLPKQHRIERARELVNSYDLVFKVIPSNSKVVDCFTRWASKPYIEKEMNVLISSPIVLGTPIEELEMLLKDLNKIDGKVEVLDHKLFIRLFLIAHAGPMGHRSVNDTIKILNERIEYKNLEEEVKKLISSCIHCIQKHNRLPVTLLGNIVIGSWPNDVVSIDGFQVTTKNIEMKWILLITDTFSKYTRIQPVKSMNAIDLVEALIKWIVEIGPMRVVTTDRGSNMISELFELILQKLKIDHHIICAFVHHGIAVVERVNRVLKEALIAALSEYQLLDSQYEQVLPLVTYGINNYKRDSLGNKSPIEVMFGLTNKLAFDYLFDKKEGELKQVDEKGMQELIQLWVKERDALKQELIEATIIRRDSIRKKNEKYLKKFKPKLVEYITGQFVLVAKPIKSGKLDMRWDGPMMVEQCISPYILKVKSIVDGTSMVRHVSQIIPYEDRLLNSEEGIKAQAAYNHCGFEVTSICDHKMGQKPTVRCNWYGFSTDEATDEPLETILQDAPVMVYKYIATKNQQEVQDLCDYLKLSYDQVVLLAKKF